jgi:hypothetical protein
MAKKIAKKIEKKVVKTTKPVKKATKKPTVKSVVKKAVKPVKKAPAKKIKKVEEEPDFELGGTPDNGELSEDFLPADELESEMMGDDLELPDDEEEEY